MSRIAFLSTLDGSEWGGSEELWSRSALRLRAAGHDVLAWVKAWPSVPPPIAALESAGARIVRRSSEPLLGRIARKVRRQSAFSWLSAWRPDLVVIAQAGFWDGHGWALECGRLGLPYVLLSQAASENWWPGDEAARAVRGAYDGAAASFWVADRNRHLLETMIGAEIPRAFVVRNPFNTAYDSPPAWPSGDDVRLACVGRLEPSAKGQDLVLNVLCQPQWRARPIFVTFFGSGPNSETLRADAERHGLNNVTFGGFVDDIDAVWAAHHALFLPSRHEGLPLALVEAMLCGRFGIVTDVAGNSELVEDGVSGFLAAAPTVNFVSDALERAWNQRTRWPEIGMAAAQRARQAFPADPPQAFAEKLLQLL